MLEHIDWVGTVALLYGLYLIGRKDKRGFLVSAVGCAIWLLWGILHGVWSLSTVNIIFVVMNTVNYYKWGKS